MNTSKRKVESIDAYIADFPETTQKLLEEVRQTIRKSTPKAAEVISYGIPTFKLKKNLVHFAGYKNHIGFYPGADAIKVFEKKLVKYKFAKGSVQFPIDELMPLALIKKIVLYRIKMSQE